MVSHLSARLWAICFGGYTNLITGERLKIDKFSRPYIRLLRGTMYNTLSEHRRGCGCDRCNKARSRHEAIGVVVETIQGFFLECEGFGHDRFLDALDALAEILKRRPYTE
jgi:hypothetical protein